MVTEGELWKRRKERQGVKQNELGGEDREGILERFAAAQIRKSGL